MAQILSVGTSVPPYELKQEEVRQFAHKMFAERFSDIDRLLHIFENTAIERRRFSKERAWFEQDHSFSERNREYIEIACQLGEEAILHCLNQVQLTPSEVDHLIFVSTTGLATPSIDAHLINRLEMNPYVKRTPVWGLGCAGGAAGLARAYEIARADPESKVLLLTLELCGLTFRRKDLSKSNLVATSLFADGAAAVLVTGEKVTLPNKAKGPRILDTMSMIWPDSLDVMGWEMKDDGFKVVFSKDIPTIVRREVRAVVDSFLSRSGLSLDDIGCYITHPGGKKVLAAYEEALSLNKGALDQAHSILRSFGNMSSATVLFVLDQELKLAHEVGTYGLLMALGPGFSTEMVLIQWE